MPATKKLPRELRDKLIVGLQVHEIVDAINIVLKARGLTLHLDYTTVFPKLQISRNGEKPVTWLEVNPKIQKCFVRLLPGLELQSAVNDLLERLGKAEARLALTTQKRRDGRKECRLQVYVDGASTIALTLLTARKGQHIIDRTFTVPGAIKP
jgi:hypothetical protein